MTWSETSIARALARQTFNRQHLVVVPNCGWTGHECDLLVVTANLLVIDVEIKISRADLKADAKKDKWWHRGHAEWDGVARCWGPRPGDARREWPRKVWKHYICCPKDIWAPDLLACLPSPASGVILVAERNHDRANRMPTLELTVERRAKPCRDAKAISPEQAVDIARLASLRMWDTYEAMDRMREDTRRQREMHTPKTCPECDAIFTHGQSCSKAGCV